MRKTSLEIKQDALLRKFGIKPKRKKKVDTNKVERIAKLKKMPYKQFLKTSYWKNVRQLVLKRDGFSCVICKYDKYLQIHHNSYKNHGDEANHIYDLMTLCKNCHKEHHFAQK